MKRMTQKEFVDDATRRFGSDVMNWKFVCPMCGTVQSVRQIHDAAVASGVKEDRTPFYVAFSCIGMFTGQKDQGISAKNNGIKWDKGCNWTLGGLLQCHNLEIVLPDGHISKSFELAE